VGNHDLLLPEKDASRGKGTRGGGQKSMDRGKEIDGAAGRGEAIVKSHRNGGSGKGDVRRASKGPSGEDVLKGGKI